MSDAVVLMATATRIGQVPESVDDGFLVRSRGSIADFVLTRSDEPARSARLLVSAGLVSPEDRLVVALQEDDVPSRDPEGRLSACKAIARTSPDRTISVTAAALRKRIESGTISLADASVGFERITRMSETAGLSDIADKAAVAFARTAKAAHLFDRGREKDGVRRSKQDMR